MKEQRKGSSPKEGRKQASSERAKGKRRKEEERRTWLLHVDVVRVFLAAKNASDVCTFFGLVIRVGFFILVVIFGVDGVFVILERFAVFAVADDEAVDSVLRRKEGRRSDIEDL
jgi:hypothetical protein